MDARGGDALIWSYTSASGTGAIRVDLARGTIAWPPRPERTLDPATIDELRALACAVRPEHELDQPSDITYACEEHLEIVLEPDRVVLDVWSGEITAGTAGALVARMRALALGAG